MALESIKLMIFELSIYLGAFLSSVYIVHKHGLNKTLTWLFLAFLSISRVFGCLYRMYAVHDSDISKNIPNPIHITASLSILTCLLHYLYLLISKVLKY
jgi:hypothetical protein